MSNSSTDEVATIGHWRRVVSPANAGSSFTPPAAKSVAGTLFGSDAGITGKNGQLPNPDLKPESGLGIDLGVDSRPTSMLTVGVRGFFTQVSDAIMENSVSPDKSTSPALELQGSRLQRHGIPAGQDVIAR